MALTEAVCDAGPLIHLDEMDSLDLLADFEAVIVPEAAWAEVQRHCPNCGASNKDSSKFCTSCGIPLTLSEQSPAICPYCGKELEKRPKRKKKCPFCQNFIYVRTLPATREKVLVTEEQAQRIQKEWDRISRRNKWLDTLKTYGITEEI